MNPKILKYAKTITSLAIIVALCGCHKDETPAVAPAAAVAPAKSGIVSAEKTSFDAVTSKLDPGGSVYIYMSTEQLLSGLSGKLDAVSNFFLTQPLMGAKADTINKVFDVVHAWVKDSGVEEISGVGVSSIAREPGFYYGKLIIHHYPGQDHGVIWNEFGSAPHALKELDLLPETTAVATFADFDIKMAWDNLQKHLKQLDNSAVNEGLDQWPDKYKKLTGLDFNETLKSLAGNYGVILTLDPEKKISLPLPGGAVEIASPGLAIVMKVNSDVIFNRVDALAKGNPLVVRVDKSDLKMRTMAIPLPLPVDLRPTLARSGDYLILATTDGMVEDLIAVRDGKKKGFKSTAEFAHLSQGIPEQGNNFSIVGEQFMKTMSEFQSQTLTNTGKLTQAQVDSLQEVFHSGKTNGGNYSVGVNGPEGWAAYANGSQSLQSSVIPVVAAIGAAAAVIIPSLVKAHASAMNDILSPAPKDALYDRIVKNLDLLQVAKQKWAAVTGKTGSELATLKDLAPYLENGALTPVAGEEYNPQPLGAAPSAHLTRDLPGHAAGSEIRAL